jgi:hypothetical protein
MQITVDQMRPDSLYIEVTKINSRDEFDRFLDRIAVAAEILWPTPDAPTDSDVIDIPNLSRDEIRKGNGGSKKELPK